MWEVKTLREVWNTVLESKNGISTFKPSMSHTERTLQNNADDQESSW